MDLLLLTNDWATLVRDFKDSEREFNIEAHQSEQLARAILHFIRYTRLRQYTLFEQQRGEEFEKLVSILEAKGFDKEAIKRFLDNEELWKLTLELGTHV